MSDFTPDISTKKTISTIWIVPIIAAILGIWVVVHNIMNEGPSFTIQFATAENLEVGKTKIKFLNVDIGMVEAITLLPNGEGILAHGKLDIKYKYLLTSDAQFWLETVQIGAGGVSGLSTLLSGAYVKVSPGTGEAGHREYIALTDPPVTRKGKEGISLLLEADNAESVSVGNSILYKGFEVGRIEAMAFNQVTNTINYDIFIEAPYNELITSSTRFWNISGVDITASAEGLAINTGSLDTIISGGVSFGASPNLSQGKPVTPGATFTLHRTFQEVLDEPFKYSRDYVVSFTQSVAGLLPNAPVSYRGIPIGFVRRIMIKEMSSNGLEHSGSPIYVLISLEPGKLELGDTPESLSVLEQAIAASIDHGLHASLETANLLTGSLYVELDYFPEEERKTMTEFAGLPVLPSMSGGIQEIKQSVTALLKKLNALPLENTVNNANSAIVQLDQSLLSINQILGTPDARDLPKNINATLRSLKATLDGLSPDSALYEELNSSLNVLNSALQNIDELTRSLSDTASVLPKSELDDPIPEAKQ